MAVRRAARWKLYRPHTSIADTGRRAAPRSVVQLYYGLFWWHERWQRSRQFVREYLYYLLGGISKWAQSSHFLYPFLTLGPNCLTAGIMCLCWHTVGSTATLFHLVIRLVINYFHFLATSCGLAYIIVEQPLDCNCPLSRSSSSATHCCFCAFHSCHTAQPQRYLHVGLGLGGHCRCIWADAVRKDYLSTSENQKVPKATEHHHDRLLAKTKILQTSSRPKVGFAENCNGASAWQFWPNLFRESGFWSKSLREWIFLIFGRP